MRRSDDDTQPIPVTGAPEVDARTPGAGRHAAPRVRRSLGSWALVIAREAGIVAAIVVAAVILARLIVGPIAYVSDDAMEPSIAAGSRVLVTSWGETAAGDLVLVRSPDAWASPTGTSVARVIAVGGQQVVCCDDSGRITVDGVALEEPYRSGPTDQVTFDVSVPDGRVFVLADRRGTARDSRALLPVEGGSLPTSDIVGRVVVVLWPPRGFIG
ncbi:MAG: signal peptidase I [Actinobacteria bacterium]|nr:signal peptidase I [Actinomycetota bacterium]